MDGVALRSVYVQIGFYAESDLVIPDAQGIDRMEELFGDLLCISMNTDPIQSLPQGIDTLINQSFNEWEGVALRSVYVQIGFYAELPFVLR